MTRFTLLTLAACCWTLATTAQCDSTAVFCESHMTSDYISDGQNYRALVYNDQVAEFEVTFFGNTSYRIAACTGNSDGNLIFTVYDQERNPLFTNKDFGNAPYWDFNVENTMDVVIEARLEEQHVSSGCAVLLIGFKQ